MSAQIDVPTINKTMTAAEWTMLLALSVLWGGSFFLTRIGLTALPPLTFVFLRVFLAALILHGVARLRRLKIPSDRSVWEAFFVMGFLNNVVPFCLIVWGQTHIASALAAILNATTPLVSVVVAHHLTADEKMTGNRLIGVVVGLLGVVIMIGPETLRGIGVGIIAQFAVLLAAVSYAFAGVYGRRFGRMGMDPVITATGQLTASFVVMFPLMLVIDEPWTLSPPGPVVWGAVAAGASLSTALAYVVYFRILATTGSTNLLLVTFLIPMSAIILGSLLLQEMLEVRHLVGIALIGTGLIAIDGRILTRARQATR